MKRYRDELRDSQIEGKEALLRTLEELEMKYDKIIDFLVEQKSVIDEFMKYLDNIDRRLKKIENKFA